MKKLLVICMLIPIINFAQNDVFGTWVTYDDETGKARSHVKIYEGKDGKTYGKITNILNPSKPNPTCDKCSGSDKGKPIEGLVIIKSLEKDDDEYDDGTITDPENGKKYDCKIWIDEDDSDILYVRGYVAFFYRTQKWKRLK